MSPAEPENRFCPRCGLSKAPLPYPHVARRCSDCGETMYLVERGKDGGIHIREGDRFTIPAGFIKISLAPTSGGVLFRPGLKFLFKQLFYARQPRDPGEVGPVLEHFDKVSDDILKRSPLLNGVDLDTEAGAAKAWDILQKNTDSREWYAALLETFVKTVQEAVEQKDNTRAVWAMYHAATAHAMTVVTEDIFEQTLWRGYLANRVVYEAAVAASSTPAEAEAIRQLEPAFGQLDEGTLYAWIHSGEPIGPKIGVKSLSEGLLKALAQWHLSLFERRRQDDARTKEEERFIRELRVKWTTIGVTGGGLVVTAIFTLLKSFGLL